MGLDEDESTRAIQAMPEPPSRGHTAPQARAGAGAGPGARPPAPRAPSAPPPRRAPPPDDDEKTAAFNLDDLPPDSRPGARGTLVGSGSQSGAAVRGGAAPPRRNETLAMSPSARTGGRQPPPKQAAPASYDDERTQAMSLDEIEKIDRGSRPSAAPAPARRGGGGPPPGQIEEHERTVAVSLEDHIAAVDSHAPARRQAPGRAAAAPAAAEPAEKTTAMSLEDLERIEGLPKRRPPPAPEKAAPPPARAKPVEAKPARAVSGGGGIDFAAGEGFVGAIGYAFKHDALEAQMQSGKAGQVALDPGRKTAGFRNLIIVGGALAALMVVFGILF